MKQKRVKREVFAYEMLNILRLIFIISLYTHEAFYVDIYVSQVMFCIRIRTERRLWRDDEILIQILFLGNLENPFFQSLHLKRSTIEWIGNIFHIRISKQLKKNYNNARGSVVYVVFVKMIAMAQTVGKFHFSHEDLKEKREGKCQKVLMFFFNNFFYFSCRFLLAHKSHSFDFKMK